MTQKYYLREDIQVEPLVNNWPAWPLIIAPATASMYIANSHIKIMKSFVMAPEVHAAALKNPAMRGGAFLDCPPRKVGQVKALLEKTIKEQAQAIAFAEAIKSMNDLLSSEARGLSLEPFYARIPDALKGYSELVYDLNHNPSIRFMEGLLYRSAYYNPASQSVALSFIKSDIRPFMFSTPKLEDDQQVILNLPFDHPALDELFKMRDEPQSLDYIKDELGIESAKEELFRSFFTDRDPRPRLQSDEGSLRVRYFGHACALIESKGVTILTDPSISYRYDNELGRYTYSDLPETIDYVLITHLHSDHTVIETLLQLRPKIRNVIVPKNGSGSLEDPSLKLLLQAIGFKNVISLDEMESIEFEGGQIMSLPFLGEHCDLAVRTKTAYSVKADGVSMLFAADSSNLEFKLYENIHRTIGDVDALFLGMECDGAPLSWIYGPLFTRPIDRRIDQSRRLSGSDYDRANGIVRLLNCKKVYIYAMGQEPWLSHIMALQYTEESKPIVESNKLIKACKERGIPAERLYVAADNLV
jgi:L-ascorbate metabolism protein UlaG (beta-lactamase superfamily)